MGAPATLGPVVTSHLTGSGVVAAVGGTRGQDPGGCHCWRRRRERRWALPTARGRCDQSRGLKRQGERRHRAMPRLRPPRRGQGTGAALSAAGGVVAIGGRNGPPAGASDAAAASHGPRGPREPRARREGAPEPRQLAPSVFVLTSPAHAHVCLTSLAHAREWPHWVTNFSGASVGSGARCARGSSARHQQRSLTPRVDVAGRWLVPRPSRCAGVNRERFVRLDRARNKDRGSSRRLSSILCSYT